AGVIVVLFATQWDRWLSLAVRQVTDDAYVRGDITPLSAQVEGYVRRVPVDDFQRVKKGEVLVETEDDNYRARVAQAEADLQAAKAEARGTEAEAMSRRCSLGLPAQPSNGEDLSQVPPDLDQTFSSVLAARADLIQSAAELGVIHSYAQSPKQMLDEFAKRGDVDRYFAQLTTEAPAVKQAEAKLEAAKRDLAQAELDLRYCDIVAEIDGVVTRRNVNPGDYVQIGQNLMAIRSLDDIWVDASFKETQLGDLRIGQAA